MRPILPRGYVRELKIWLDPCLAEVRRNAAAQPPLPWWLPYVIVTVTVILIWVPSMVSWILMSRELSDEPQLLIHILTAVGFGIALGYGWVKAWQYNATQRSPR